jgi:hypothetical protein
MCGTSAQVSEQRRNHAGIRQQGLARARTNRRTVTHTQRSRWPAQRPTRGRIPGTATLRLRGNAFATIRSCWASCTGERAPANWRSGSVNRTSQRQDPEIQLRCRLSKIFRSGKELAKIRAKTSELGEKGIVATDQFERRDGRATCGPVDQRAVDVLVCEDRLGLFRLALPPFQSPGFACFPAKRPVSTRLQGP